MIISEHQKNKIVVSLSSLNPEQIILFGSHAYGNPNDDSDLDLCVVEKILINKAEEKRKIRQLLQDIKMPKDILVSSVEEFDFYKNEINSIFNDINSKGIVLWPKN